MLYFSRKKIFPYDKNNNNFIYESHNPREIIYSIIIIDEDDANMQRRNKTVFPGRDLEVE